MEFPFGGRRLLSSRLPTVRGDQTFQSIEGRDSRWPVRLKELEQKMFLQSASALFR